MIAVEQIERLAVALAIGLLIGLERGWQARKEGEGERTAGVRTFALSSVLGGLWATLSQQHGGAGVVALAAAFVAFSGAIVLFRYRETGHDGTFGATTVVAAMLAFTLGAAAVLGSMQVAGAAGVAVAGLLVLKKALHDWLSRISWIELRSTLLLLAMTFILLPILPHREVDPWGLINPFELWLMTIMIAAISFVGYVAIKVAGEQAGTILTGLAGGLVSSTAVTLTLARLAREQPAMRAAALSGALIASMTMMLRVLVVVGLVQAPLLARIGPAVAVAAVVLMVAALPFLLRRAHGGPKDGGPKDGGSKDGELALTNPFDIRTVLQFALLLAILTILARGTAALGSAPGVLALAAVSGIADVDAIVLSVSRLSTGALGGEVAARAILVAVAVNSVAKAVLGWVAGGRRFGGVMMLAALAAIAAGLVAHFLLPVRWPVS